MSIWYNCSTGLKTINKPSLAAQINFNAINIETYKEELLKVEWEKTLDVPDHKVSSALVQAICSAAMRVTAPMYRYMKILKGNKERG